MRFSVVALVASTSVLPTVLGGPLAYALCQTACNAGAVVCYAGAGCIFGTVAAPAAPAAIVACNTVQATCMAACTAALLAPTL